MTVIKRIFVCPALITAALSLSVAMVSAQGSVVGSGSFTGKSGHDTSGGVDVVKSGDGYAVVLKENFSLDRAPDPKVGFGMDGKYDPASKLGHLRSNDDRQNYSVPSVVDLNKYNEVYIWCERFNVPLGVARFR